MVLRMPDVSVALLSSAVTPRHATILKQQIREGAINVLVGTHAILSSNVCFANLGLLVVDEEQRFGVMQKEQMKAKWPIVDVLLLSATPIPRTLHMSFSGIRSMSVLETPPPGRLSVETIVCERSDALIAHAVKAELARGGQVLFVVPRISTIQEEYSAADRTRDLRLALALKVPRSIAC